MNNPLSNLPLNTNRSFLCAKLPTGCSLYVPVDSMDDEVLKRKKLELQSWVDETFFQPDPMAA